MQFIVIVFLQFHLWSSPCFKSWLTYGPRWPYSSHSLCPSFHSILQSLVQFPRFISGFTPKISASINFASWFLLCIPLSPNSWSNANFSFQFIASCVIQYGEFVRWSLIGVKVCLTTNSPNTVHRFCSGQVGRIKVWIFGAWRVNNVHWTLQVCSVLHLAALERGECR